MPALKPIALIAVLTASTALAQDHPGNNRPSTKEVAPSPSSPDLSLAPHWLSFTFPGGTVGQYVEILRESSSQPINVVIPPHATKVNMAAVSLKEVSLLDALNAILAVADIPSNEAWEIRKLAELSGPLVGGGGPGVTAESTPSFAILTNILTNTRTSRGGVMMTPGSPQNPTTNTRTATAVFSIRELLDSGMKPDAVLTAIDTALSMDKESVDPQVKFHEESALLILRATNEQLDAARQVITRLGESARATSRSRAAADRRNQFDRMKAEIGVLYDQLAKARSDASSERSVLNSRNMLPKTPEQAAQMQAEIKEEQDRIAQSDVVVDRLDREVRSHEQQLQQLQIAEVEMSGDGDPRAEITRLRAENTELRERLDKLEKQAR